MANIIENMPSGDSCLASLPSAHEMPVSHEVIVPLPATLMGFPVVTSDDVPGPMEGMRFGCHLIGDE